MILFVFYFLQLLSVLQRGCVLTDDCNIMWYQDKELAIGFNHKPHTNMLEPLPGMSAEEVKLIEKYPFINYSNLDVKLFNHKKNKSYSFTIPKKFRWDGATIAPVFWLLIGTKTDPRFKIPSMIHDFMCNNKDVVNFDRNFSSKVFRSLLIVSKVSKIKAQTMYIAVDNFQKFRKGWKG